MYFYHSSCRDFFWGNFVLSDVTTVFGARFYDCNHAHTEERLMPVESPSVVVNIVGAYWTNSPLKEGILVPWPSAAF